MNLFYKTPEIHIHIYFNTYVCLISYDISIRQSHQNCIVKYLHLNVDPFREDMFFCCQTTSNTFGRWCIWWWVFSETAYRPYRCFFFPLFFPLEDHHHHHHHYHHHHHHSSFRNPGTGGISNSWWPSTFLFKPRGHQTPKTRCAETRVVVVDLQRMAWESGSRWWHPKSLTCPPETNSSHLEITPWKRRFLLETIIFRGYVSFGECNLC